MKIVLVNQNYPPHTGYGGIAVYLQSLARVFVTLGHQTIIIAGRYDLTVPEIEMDQGVEVHRILVNPISWLRKVPFLKAYARGLAKVQYSKKVCVKLRQLSEKEKPDIIEFSEIEAEGFSYLRRKKHGKVIIRCHTPTFVLSKYHRSEMPYNLGLISWMEKKCILKANGLTAPSQDMARQISKECQVLESQIRVIPNPVQGYGILDKERAQDSECIRVLHVGRFETRKGIEVIAKAVPLVIKENPKVHFVFVGDDCPDGHGTTWKKRLQSSFEEKNILKNISMIGFADEKKLKELYSDCDIAVIPTIMYESFSYTCAQAMAAGLPVVASRIGGIPETVEDGVTGILTETGNVEQLAGAILKLSKDAALRRQIGQSGYQRFQEKFEAVKIAKQMLSFYEDVMRSSK